MKPLTRIAALALILAAGTLPGHSGDYHWCANDGQSRSGGLACYYATLDQCRAAVSGSGAFCMPNYADPERQPNPPTRRRR
jgi:hypothetical protein